MVFEKSAFVCIMHRPYALLATDRQTDIVIL